MDLVPSTGTLAHSSANDDSISSMIQKKKAEDALVKRMEELKLQKAMKSENEKLKKENLEVKDENERLKKEIQELKLKEQKASAENEFKNLLKLNSELEDSLKSVKTALEANEELEEDSEDTTFLAHLASVEDALEKRMEELKLQKAIESENEKLEKENLEVKDENERLKKEKANEEMEEDFEDTTFLAHLASVSSNFKKMLMALKSQKSLVEKDLKESQKIKIESQDLKHKYQKINLENELEKLMKEKSDLEDSLKFAERFFVYEIKGKYGSKKLVMALKNQIAYMEEKLKNLEQEKLERLKKLQSQSDKALFQSD